jgi:hypothetical protein
MPTGTPKNGINNGWFKRGHKSSTQFKKGCIVPLEVRKKMSETKKRLGMKPFPNPMPKEKNPNWKGGVTPANQKIRTSTEYKLWRKSVFERDNYRCIWGGKSHGNKLHADHIKPFSLFPELRLAIDNGRTLCEDCHKKTDTYLKNTKKYREN